MAPLAGVLLIAEQSAANLGEAVYWRALLATSAAVLALNVLVAAYSEGAGFWDTRCMHLLAAVSCKRVPGAVVSRLHFNGQFVTMKLALHPKSTSG